MTRPLCIHCPITAAAWDRGTVSAVCENCVRNSASNSVWKSVCCCHMRSLAADFCIPWNTFTSNMEPNFWRISCWAAGDDRSRGHDECCDNWRNECRPCFDGLTPLGLGKEYVVLYNGNEQKGHRLPVPLSFAARFLFSGHNFYSGH